MKQLTARQKETLMYLRHCGVAGSGSEGSILKALEKKGLVSQHFNAGGGSAIYYTWTLTDKGMAATKGGAE